MDVPARLLIILALLGQVLLPWVSGVPSASPSGCVATPCCITVERVTCCGERVVEQVCGMTGGECHCGAAPSDTPRRVPQIPQPRNEREAFVGIPGPDSRIVTPVQGEPNRRVTRSGVLCLLSGKTHGEIRAFLGVWRT